jgi:hypothetical protein
MLLLLMWTEAKPVSRLCVRALLLKLFMPRLAQDPLR